MLSKEDVRSYLEGMMKTEKKMEKTYLELSQKVKNPHFIAKFLEMKQEEIGHQNLILSLMSLLEKP